MPRLTRVKAARKADLTCYKCHQPIQRGTPYAWAKPRYGAQRNFHDDPVTHPSCRPSGGDLEFNEKRAGIARASASVVNAQNADNPNDAAAHLRDAISEVESVIEQFDESIDGWSGSGLENSQQAQDFENAKDELETWQSNAEEVANDLEELASNEPHSQADDLEPRESDYETDEDGELTEEAQAEFDNDLEAWTTDSDNRNQWEDDVETKIGEIEDLPEPSF